MQKRFFLKKGDLFVVTAVLLLGVAVWLLQGVLHPTTTNGVVEIVSNGAVYGRYSLSVPQELVITAFNGGVNTVHIADGKVWVTDASCMKHHCEKQGAVNRRGETIACVENRLLITVQDGEQSDVDFIVR